MWGWVMQTLPQDSSVQRTSFNPLLSVIACDPEAHGEFLDVLVTSGVYKELCFGDWYPRPSGGSEVSGYTGYLLGHGLVEWNLQRGWSKGVGVREDLLP